ncbi:MAG: DUF3991 and TOPRIM domain-containing protein [Bacteroidales bacterium]|nr:DUF3991 and TOPRIM domain-containing protein [Bacteroidales bacterium]
MDLLSFLRRYKPDELKYLGGGEFSTATHDSLKISNGKWHWFSRGIGGRTALDYLINVEGKTFTEAMHLVLSVKNQLYLNPEFTKTSRVKRSHNKPDKPFDLPAKADDNNRAIAYLRSRGISIDIIKQCIRQGLIYQDKLHGNVVFIGKDISGKPRNAMLRGTGHGSNFKKDAPGSNKNYSFSYPAANHSDCLRVFESAIDLLSDMTIQKHEANIWSDVHRLSLGGLAANALHQYLQDHSGIRQITFCLDNDEPGLTAARELSAELIARGFTAESELPPQGKDYNEFLCKYYEPERIRNSSIKHKSQKEER